MLRAPNMLKLIFLDLMGCLFFFLIFLDNLQQVIGFLPNPGITSYIHYLGCTVSVSTSVNPIGYTTGNRRSAALALLRENSYSGSAIWDTSTLGPFTVSVSVNSATLLRLQDNLALHSISN